MAPHVPVAAAVAILAAIVMPRAADDPVVLRERRAVGDVVVMEALSRAQLTMTATVDGHENPPATTDHEERQSFRETVLTLDARGRPSAVRRFYTVARNVVRVQGEVRETPSPLQGKTVTIRRVGSKVQVTASAGTLPAEETADLQQALEGAVDQVLPAGPIALGERWSGPCPAMVRMAGPGATATVLGVAEERVTYAGRPCIRAHIEVEVTGKPAKERLAIRMALDGDLYYATDIGRTLLLDIQGPATLSGDVEEQGAKIAVKGSGKVHVRVAARFEKLGGQAPPR